MALIKFLAKIFKKIAKLFGGGKRKEAVTSDRLPGERRIGIYGPSAVGKSVFFTMLYNACRSDREFNLAPDDQQTGAQLLNNLNTLRAGEWLAGTVEESELNFKASLRGGASFPFSSKDYKGELVDLEQDSPSRADLIAYFRDCDAILFLLSPEMIADHRKCEREILNFQAMINQVTESGGRGLRIPVGLMITKADAIPGFENDHQVRLIGRSAEYLKAKSFNEFVDGLCEQSHIKQNIVFQEQVRTLLQSMSIFFDFLMTLSLEFQVFFLSSVGRVRTETAPDGTTMVKPPENPSGIGVKRPFLWVVDTIRERERIARFNTVRRTVFSLALVVLLVYSLVYGLHLLPGRSSLRAMVDKGENAQHIGQELGSYANSWTLGLNTVFPLPGSHIGDVRTDARRLHATFEAEQFLRNEFTLERTTDELRALKVSFESGEASTSHPWFPDLSGPQQRSVLTAMARVIATHNLRIATEVERLRAAYGGAAVTASEDVLNQCDELIASFIEPPANLPDFDTEAYYRTLMSDARDVRQLLGARQDIKRFQSDWSGLLRRLPDICIGVPSLDQFQQYQASVRALEGELIEADARDTRELLAEVSEFAELMRTFLEGIAENSPKDVRKSKLNAVVRQARDDYPELRAYALQIRDGLDSDTRGERESRLAGLIDARLQEANPWLEVLSTSLEREVKSVTWLTGPREAARKRFIANLESLRNEGVALTMMVAEVADNCAVTVWDAGANGFTPAQALAGDSLPVHWTAGQRIKIAVVRTGQATPEYCPRNGLEDFVPRLHRDRRELTENCSPRTAGFLEVRFQELEALIQKQLIDPLQEAFPKQ